MNLHVAERALPARKQGGTGLQISLWIVQVLLGLLFGMAGAMKLLQPMAALVTTVTWAADLPVALVRFIGAAELAGALGLLLPALTRIRPVLVPLAATGLATIMVLAIGFHLARGEAPVTGMNLLFGSLAAFVAWGRFRRAPIAPRT
jgi:putative oxidoreductase